MRYWETYVQSKVNWIKDLIKHSNSQGIVVGLSGGKDSAVVASLCRIATPNLLGVLAPCESSLAIDKEYALLMANQLQIKTITVDLTDVYYTLVSKIEEALNSSLSDIAKANIKPRVRMTNLYAISQNQNYLVAGTGNLSEIYTGYFTKWGDSGVDFNPISDLTVKEVIALGKFLNVPELILQRKPSAGLWEGQIDEDELGITYEVIDRYLIEGIASKNDLNRIMHLHNKTEHKRHLSHTLDL